VHTPKVSDPQLSKHIQFLNRRADNLGLELNETLEKKIQVTKGVLFWLLLL
jgi:hypothetical protein